MERDEADARVPVLAPSAAPAAAKYSNPELGRRNLEALAAATFEATLLSDAYPAFRQNPNCARTVGQARSQ